VPLLQTPFAAIESLGEAGQNALKPASRFNGVLVSSSTQRLLQPVTVVSGLPLNHPPSLLVVRSARRADIFLSTFRPSRLQNNRHHTGAAATSRTTSWTLLLHPTSTRTTNPNRQTRWLACLHNHITTASTPHETAKVLCDLDRFRHQSLQWPRSRRCLCQLPLPFHQIQMSFRATHFLPPRRVRRPQRRVRRRCKGLQTGALQANERISEN
jgi:hypothetical protein